MIRFLLNLYMILLVVDVVLSYLPQFRHLPAVIYIRKAADFTCRPIRRLLPPDLPFDFSPLIVMCAIQLVKALW